MDSSQSTMPGVEQRSTFEALSDGVTREWLFDQQIVVYTIKDVRRESVDIWIAAFKADVAVWPADRPFLVIHDFTAPAAVATPYARTRSQEIVDIHPEVKGKVGLVLSNTVFNSLIHLFLNKQTGTTPRIRKTFKSRDEAIKWLVSTR